MKKVLMGMLAVILVISLCACGGVGKKCCTVTFDDGTTKTLSPSELSDICSNDAVTWENYVGAKISGEGKITGIDKGSNGFYYITESAVKNGVEYKYEYYQIEINTYIKVLVRSETFKGMVVGDTVRFEGKINSGSSLYNIRVDNSDDSVENPQAHIFLK